MTGVTQCTARSVHAAETSFRPGPQSPSMGSVAARTPGLPQQGRGLRVALSISSVPVTTPPSAGDNRGTPHPSKVWGRWALPLTEKVLPPRRPHSHEWEVLFSLQILAPKGRENLNAQCSSAGFHGCPQFPLPVPWVPRLRHGPVTCAGPAGPAGLSVQLEGPGPGRALGTLNGGNGQAPPSLRTPACSWRPPVHACRFCAPRTFFLFPGQTEGTRPPAGAHGGLLSEGAPQTLQEPVPPSAPLVPGAFP